MHPIRGRLDERGGIILAGRVGWNVGWGLYRPNKNRRMLWLAVVCVCV